MIRTLIKLITNFDLILNSYTFDIHFYITLLILTRYIHEDEMTGI